MLLGEVQHVLVVAGGAAVAAGALAAGVDAAERMAVIAAIGTRPYYLERGFERGELYLVKDL